MSILAIDTSLGTTSSIAIVERDGSCLVERDHSGKDYSETIFHVLDTVFSKHGYNFTNIDYLVVVVGPGSFTRIRVGISAAQGINLVMNKPLYGVSALEVQAYAIYNSLVRSKESIRAIIIKNAKVFYTQLFDLNLLPISEPEAINSEEYSISALMMKKDTSVRHVDYCNLPELDASHAGMLLRYRLENKQELGGANALYLSEPSYTKLL